MHAMAPSVAGLEEEDELDLGPSDKGIHDPQEHSESLGREEMQSQVQMDSYLLKKRKKRHD